MKSLDLLKLKNKKASQGFTVQKLVVIIIVLCVIAIVLLAIFNPAIWDWIKNLHGFEQSPEEPDLSADSMKALGYWIVGRVEAKDKIIYIVTNSTQRDNVKDSEMSETKLYADVGTDNNGYIRLLEEVKLFDTSTWHRDIIVGIVKQEHFFIDSKIYDKVKDSSVLGLTSVQLGLMDKSKWVSGYLWRLKKDAVTEIKAWPEREGYKKLNLVSSDFTKTTQTTKVRIGDNSKIEFFLIRDRYNNILLSNSEKVEGVRTSFKGIIKEGFVWLVQDFNGQDRKNEYGIYLNNLATQEYGYRGDKIVLYQSNIVIDEKILSQQIIKKL